MPRKPKATVCIPWRPSPSRMRPYERVREFWAKNFPTWPVVLADSNSEIFSLSQARNNAVRQAKTDVVVVADADTIPPIPGVKAAVKDPTGVIWPYTTWRLIPAEWADKPFKDFPAAPAVTEYADGLGAVMVTTPAEYWRLGGQREEFQGWGCVDELTEILTSTGWKAHRDLRIGEQVLTLNHETGLSEWNPVKNITTHPAGVSKKMLSIKSATHSSFTTMDHRWPVFLRQGTPDWRTTETLQQHDRVPVSAVCADLPAVPAHDDSLIELVAWFFTEGSTRRGRGGSIGQSHAVHPEYCAKIESALQRTFGDPSERFVRRGPSRVPHAPQWYRRDNARIAYFHLNPEACDLLLSCAPDKVPSFEFLLSLTQRQLDLFIEIAMMGDGSRRNDPGLKGGRQPTARFEQRDPRAAEAFAFAVLLSGRGVSVRRRKNNAKGDRSSGVPKDLDYAMTIATIRSRDRFSPLDGHHEIVDYDGLIWCPTTANSTWLARREGTVYFTGNCEDCAFQMVVTTLSKFRREPGIAFSIDHNDPTGVADTPGWSRDDKHNLPLLAPYRAAAGRPWLMREILRQAESTLTSPSKP